MNRFFPIVLFLLSFSVFSQTGETILEIRYGTQFGMCEGYCFSEEIYTDSKVNIIQKAWMDTITNPPKIKTATITKETWTEITSKVGLDSFFNLKTQIGCPDCDDRGEAWVTIKTNDREKNVSFEYNKPPKELLELISCLRKTR